MAEKQSGEKPDDSCSNGSGCNEYRHTVIKAEDWEAYTTDELGQKSYLHEELSKSPCLGNIERLLDINEGKPILVYTVKFEGGYTLHEKEDNRTFFPPQYAVSRKMPLFADLRNYLNTCGIDVNVRFYL